MQGMPTSEKIKSGDVVFCSSKRIYGIFFLLKDLAYFLKPGGEIEQILFLEHIQWICHTALVHTPFCESLEQVKKDFKQGKFKHVTNSIPGFANG